MNTLIVCVAIGAIVAVWMRFVVVRRETIDAIAQSDDAGFRRSETAGLRVNLGICVVVTIIAGWALVNWGVLAILNR